jgi:2-polyprenyl-3-methyl-5-hydroxy-6-metoxy-1,4-benzoquinol methylase
LIVGIIRGIEMGEPQSYTWDQCYLDEYAKGKHLLHGEKPDEFVVWVSEYPRRKGMNGATILDADCGEGRNSIYLGKQGFRTYGIDVAYQQ